MVPSFRKSWIGALAFLLSVSCFCWLCTQSGFLRDCKNTFSSQWLVGKWSYDFTVGLMHCFTILQNLAGAAFLHKGKSLLQMVLQSNKMVKPQTSGVGQWVRVTSSGVPWVSSLSGPMRSLQIRRFCCSHVRGVCKPLLFWTPWHPGLTLLTLLPRGHFSPESFHYWFLLRIWKIKQWIE